MRKQIDWRDPSTLHDINAFQAFQVLAEISAHFRQSTTDARTNDEFANMDATAEARAFADNANALGRRLRSQKDCRPTLRQQADERRETKLDDAEEFAANAKRYHRR